MGDPRGFLKVKRQTALYRPVCERVKDYKDVLVHAGAKRQTEPPLRAQRLDDQRVFQME